MFEDLEPGCPEDAKCNYGADLEPYVIFQDVKDGGPKNVKQSDVADSWPYSRAY